MKARIPLLLLLVLGLPASSWAGGAADVRDANGRIVFVAADGNGVASMNPDGSGVWGLMVGGGDGEPSWSPDGSRLALAVRWPGLEGITVMDPQGWHNRSRLTFSATHAQPTWSADGSTIAFSDGDDIMLVPAAGGASARLTGGPAIDVQPAWSPDGTTVAFTRWSDGSPSVWTVAVATGEATLAVAATAPSWSPRGELTYVDGAAAFLRTADGTTTRLASPVDWGSSIVWSPDGTQFLFVRDAAVWRAGRDGAAPTRLVAGRSPAWQPLPPAPLDCTLWGTSGADILVGTGGDDVLCGLDGNDTVIGLDGADLLRGGPGNDWIAGGQGFDRLYGNGGDDRLDSRDGSGDLVIGGANYDTALLERADAKLELERPRYDGNLAAWRPVRASGLGIPDPPERVVDGRADDFWNSGGWPPAWIEVDLLHATDIRTIRLVTGPQPRGVIHLVLGKGPATRGAYRVLRTLRGPTATRQEVVLTPKRPWRGIRRLRIETQAGSHGAAWVSWHEIEVYAPRR